MIRYRFNPNDSIRDILIDNPKGNYKKRFYQIIEAEVMKQ